MNPDDTLSDFGKGHVEQLTRDKSDPRDLRRELMNALGFGSRLIGELNVLVAVLATITYIPGVVFGGWDPIRGLRVIVQNAALAAVCIYVGSKMRTWAWEVELNEPTGIWRTGNVSKELRMLVMMILTLIVTAVILLYGVPEMTERFGELAEGYNP